MGVSRRLEDEKGGWEKETETDLFLDFLCGCFDLFLVHLRDLAPVDLQSPIHEEMRAFQYYTPPFSITIGRSERGYMDVLCLSSQGNPTNGGVFLLNGPQSRITATLSRRHAFLSTNALTKCYITPSNEPLYHRTNGMR